MLEEAGVNTASKKRQKAKEAVTAECDEADDYHTYGETALPNLSNQPKPADN
jgi:phytoene/squalene synthetase